MHRRATIRVTTLLAPVALALAALALPLATGPALGQELGGQELEGGGGLVVEADERLEWRRGERRYIASGNAAAIQGDVALRADRIEARYRGGGSSAGSGGKVEFTRLEGFAGAEIRYAATTARADHIDYDITANRAILSGGNPSISAAGDQIAATGHITYNRGDREVLAEGQVMVVLADGKRLEADLILALVNEAENEVSFIRASGNAVAYAAGGEAARSANADEIIYTKETGKAVLAGSVTIRDGANTVTGDRAEFDLATGVSKLTAKSGRVGGVFPTAR